MTKNRIPQIEFKYINNPNKKSNAKEAIRQELGASQMQETKKRK